DARAMRRPRHRFRRASRGRGQAMVDFALVAPIFFLMVFAIIAGGRFILYSQTLNNAVREGARYAIVHGYNSFCPSGPMPPSVARAGGCCGDAGAHDTTQARTQR